MKNQDVADEMHEKFPEMSDRFLFRSVASFSEASFSEGTEVQTGVLVPTTHMRAVSVEDGRHERR